MAKPSKRLTMLYTKRWNESISKHGQKESLYLTLKMKKFFLPILTEVMMK